MRTFTNNIQFFLASTLIDIRVLLISISFILFFVLNVNANDAIQSILLEDCNQYEEFCLDINTEDFTSYKVLVNGKSFVGDYRNCNYDVANQNVNGQGVAIRLGVGEYVIETINATTGEKNMKEISITCVESKNVKLNKNWIGQTSANNVVIVGGAPS